MRGEIAVLLLVVLSGLAAPEVRAEIEGLQLEVDGLSCPFCAIGLDKSLKRRAGLQDIDIHLKQGVTEAKLPQGQGLDVGKVRLAFKESGFTLRAIKLTVLGRLVRDENHLAVESRGDGTRFLLFDPEHREGETTTVLGLALAQRLEQAEASQRLIRVSGVVHEHTGMPAGLMVETVEDVDE